MSHPSNKDPEWLKLIGMPGHFSKKTRVYGLKRTLGRIFHRKKDPKPPEDTQHTSLVLGILLPFE